MTANKSIRLALLCTALTTPVLMADPTEKKAKPLTKQDIAAATDKHAKGAAKLADEQDSLSADVQDLIHEQTNPKVIELLKEVENIMADAIDQLENKDTGGGTIATETEVIEKIFEAAKQKQQQSGQKGQQQMNPMLEMMKQMMQGGEDKGEQEGEQPGEKPGKKPGDKPGKGGGSGGSANGKAESPDNTDPNSVRRVPKSSGNTSGSLPREFQKAMDAYNKGAAKKANNK
ncbi:MAG: hypothetical protein ACPG32_10930 [Akkermansiaceae bacterium]